MTTSVIAKTASRGEATLLGEFCRIGENVTIGSHCEIGSGVVIHDDSTIGDEVRIDDGFGRFPARFQIAHGLAEFYGR